MSGFLNRILSGKYPNLESLWKTEFEKLVDEVFSKIDMSDLDEFVDDAGLDDEFDTDSYVERELNTEIEALRADLSRLEDQFCEERQRHEAAKRELAVVKAELKAAQYKLGAVRSAVGRSNLHDEPLG